MSSLSLTLVLVDWKYMTEDKKKNFLAQFDSAKKDVEKLRQIFPEFFDKNGRALVAELRFPKVGELK